MKVKVLVIFIFCHLAVAATAQQLDKKSLLSDIKTLSSVAFGGREPGSTGHQRAVAYLIARFQALNLKPYHGSYIDTFSINTGIEGYNIIGYIPGKQAEAIVISGHYDHLGEHDGKIYHGADDNASGTSALLALADYFSQHRPNHTLIFAAFDAEEMGLQGAKAFIDDPPIPLADIVLNINMDMVSRNDRQELYVCGTYHYPHLLPFITNENPVVTLKAGHDEPGSGHDDWTWQSDHAAFHHAGIPFLYFGVEDHPDYHTPNDTYENIQPDFFYHAVATILEVLKKADGQVAQALSPFL